MDATRARVRPELKETLSLAFLVLLESLAPPERAAFLLRDVVGFSYEEIAPALDRSEPATRQLVHRAQRALESRRPRFRVSPEQHRELLRRFLHACSGGDVDGLPAILAETPWPTPTAAARPVRGRLRAPSADGSGPPGASVQIVTVNGHDGILLRAGGAPVALVDVTVDRDLVARVDLVAAPSKLREAVAART
jgi:RNA polymerase sigma-70 factor (ECF subfamily)